MAVDIDFSKPADDEAQAPQAPVNLDFSPSQSVAKPEQPIEVVTPQEPVKPKSWQENKKLAAIVLVVGLVIIVLVFYFLFSSAGLI